MPLYDPFLVFGGTPDLSFEDAFGSEDLTFVPSVDFTSGLLGNIPQSSGGGQGFFNGLFKTAKGALGLANSGVDLLDGFDLAARKLTGDGFLPDQRLAPAQQGSLLPQLPSGAPLLLLLAGGGAAVYFALR